VTTARIPDPDYVYVGFVRSLFNAPAILLIGGVIHAVISLTILSASGDTVYLFLAAALFVAGIYRFHGIREGQKAIDQIVDLRSAKEWENRYLIGGTLQAFLLGLLCFTTLYIAPVPFGELASITVVLGSTVSIVGRNYGSRQMVAVQAVAVVVPIGAGLMLKSDIYYFMLGLCLIPYIYVLITMARHVRSVLFNAITQERKSWQIAQRFDRALNTMGHGLVMLGADGQVVVANAEASRALGFPGVDKMLGRNLRSLFGRAVAAGLLTPKDMAFLSSQLVNPLGSMRDRKMMIPLTDGRYFELTAREGARDLGVLTFEEVTQRVQSEERIRYMARFDGLTDLPNRAYFNETVTEMVAKGDPDRLCGIAIFDLDDFKSVNDTLGHPVGDGLIAAVANFLGEFAGPNVVVGRVGGDEFTLFVNSVEHPDELGEIMDRVFSELQGDLDIAGHSIRVMLSGGVVLAKAGDFDIDTMLVNADLALYSAKEAGKNQWRLFESVMDHAFRNRQLMKADLRNAIESKSLRAVFQPIIAMDTMRIASCEALCRWDHPELGPISPAVFIPLAEEMGIVGDISDFILEAACVECATWAEHVAVSVNMSAKDFQNGEIVAKVAAALKRHKLHPSRLEIEVTETALLDDKKASVRYIQELKKLGVRVALDDFGTGYSSLSYLHSLPLDKVKIDRSFLADIAEDQRSLDLVRGVVELSRTLGLKVTIEGVETFDQLRILHRLIKPDLVQGFLFGSPLSASGIATMSNTTWPFTGQLDAELHYSQA
jgi:diguanylate cyclase (GGDEF)-like protein